MTLRTYCSKWGWDTVIGMEMSGCYSEECVVECVGRWVNCLMAKKKGEEKKIQNTKKNTTLKIKEREKRMVAKKKKTLKRKSRGRNPFSKKKGGKGILFILRTTQFSRFQGRAFRQETIPKPPDAF